jgi:hypothetical protein
MTQIPIPHMAQGYPATKTPAAGARRPQRGGGRGGGRGNATSGGDSQKKQRVTFPWINSQIIAAADTENLAHLVNTITTYLPRMNLVNLSTALHRLAKLAGSDQQTQRSLQMHALLPALLATVYQALSKSQVTGTLPKCQALSNITWACATMQVVDLPLLQMVAAFCQVQLQEFKNFELCQLLWAFAKLGAMNGAHCLCESTLPLFRSAGEFVIMSTDNFTFRGLVMTAWAFATARLHDPRLFHAIAERLMPSLHEANCQELANTAWSFSTAGVHQDTLFEMLAQASLPRLLEFKPQELSSILWSFASIGCVHDDFYVAAAHASLRMKLQAQQLANILWALTKMRPRHTNTRDVVVRLLPRCTQLIETFKPQELASVALAAGKSFGKVDQEYLEQPPKQVIAFFQAALPLAEPRLREYSGQSLANLTNSVLSLQLGADSGLFDAVSCEILRRTESFENSALLLLVKSLPQAPIRSAAVHSATCLLFNEAARRVERLTPREVQVLHRICIKLQGLEDSSASASKEELRLICLNLASTGASGGFFPCVTTDYSHIGEVNDAHGDRRDSEEIDEDGNDLLEDKWATGPMTLAVAPDQQTASAWDAEATQQLREAMETSMAKREEQEDLDVPTWLHSDASASGSTTQAKELPHYVLSVKNTFLDIEEENAEEVTAEEDLSAIDLPPALDFIPDSVSAEKLQAYRANYARFRVGNAIGAKGELDTVS